MKRVTGARYNLFGGIQAAGAQELGKTWDVGQVSQLGSANGCRVEDLQVRSRSDGSS